MQCTRFASAVFPHNVNNNRQGLRRAYNDSGSKQHPHCVSVEGAYISSQSLFIWVVVVVVVVAFGCTKENHGRPFSLLLLVVETYALKAVCEEATAVLGAKAEGAKAEAEAAKVERARAVNFMVFYVNLQ